MQPDRKTQTDNRGTCKNHKPSRANEIYDLFGLLKHIIWSRLGEIKPFCKYFNQRLSQSTQLQEEEQNSECGSLALPENVPVKQTEQSVRDQIVRRFEKWLDDVLAEEEPLQGIADELFSELEGKSESGVICAPDNRCDLYSMWSAMTALTQEVKLQGRAFRHLSDKLEPFSGLGESIDTVLEAHTEALSDARRIAAEARAVRGEHENELLRDAERRGRHEILSVLLDTRNRLVRGLKAAHESFGKLDEYRASNWPTRIFIKQGRRIGHMLDIVTGLEKGYSLSLDRLDDAMQQLGVREIPCEGQPFDPRFMNVVDVEENAEAPDGTVLEVYRTGYMLDTEIVHPAQVKVARAPAKTA